MKIYEKFNENIQIDAHTHCKSLGGSCNEPNDLSNTFLIDGINQIKDSLTECLCINLYQGDNSYIVQCT